MTLSLHVAVIFANFQNFSCFSFFFSPSTVEQKQTLVSTKMRAYVILALSSVVTNVPNKTLIHFP